MELLKNNNSIGQLYLSQRFLTMVLPAQNNAVVGISLQRLDIKIEI